MKEKIEYVNKNCKQILISTAVVAVVSVFISYIFKTSLILFSVLSLIGAVSTYASSRVDMSDEEVDKNFRYMSTAVLFGVFGIVHHIFYRSIYKKMIGLSEDGEVLSYMYMNLANTAFIISFMLNLAMVILLVIYLRDEIRRERFESLKDMSFTPFEKENEKASETEPDIVLCKDVDTGKNVIWPHHDRYTHMLVLGPTEITSL